MPVLNYYRIYSSVQAQNQYVFGLTPPTVDTTGGAIIAADQLKTTIINTVNIPYYTYAISTGPYSALALGGTITANTTTAAIVINLPASLTTSKEIYFIVNSGTNNLTLTPFGAETINAVATYILAAGRSVAIQESGGNFIIDAPLILDQVESMNINGHLQQSGSVTINAIPTFNDINGNSFNGSGITIDSSNNLVIPAGGSLSTPNFVVPLAAPTTALTAATTNASGSAGTYNASDHTHAITTGIVLQITPDLILSAGTGAPLARADHVHNIPTAAPITAISATATLGVGNAATFARSDHIHTISTAAPSTLVFDTAATVGVSASLARADHVHNIVSAAPSAAISATATAGAGVATSFSRSDHIHTISTAAAVAQVPDQVNAIGVSASMARADHVHNILTAAPIAAISATATAAVGTAASFARSDHVHTILTALPLAITPDQTLTIGTSASLARADHIHQIASAAPSAAILATTATGGIGVSTSFARSDHIHTIGTAAAITQVPDQANAVGTSASFARADHVHQIATAAPSTLLATTTVNGQGASTSFARADHVHAILTASAVSIGSTNSVGGGVVTTFAASDHVHQGIHSLKVGAGGTQRYGDQALIQSGLVGITDDGAGNITVDVPRQIKQMFRAFGTGAVGNNSVGITLTGTTPTVWSSMMTFAYRGSTINGGLPTRFGIIYSVPSGTGTFSVRLFDVTNSAVIATIAIPVTLASQAYLDTTAFSNVQLGPAIYEIQVSRTAGTSKTLSMFSAHLEY
jgi:hypothetical protein